MKKWTLLMVLVLAMGLAMGFTACSDDDDDDDTTGPTEPTIDEMLVGEWLSADANVAPLLVALFSYDSVEVVMNANQTVTLTSHVENGAWSAPVNGTWSVTPSETGDIHAIALNYTTFEQEGIVEVTTSGGVTTMRLEVVQTVPDIGATVPTVSAGFGANSQLGTTNIQTFILQ